MSYPYTVVIATSQKNKDTEEVEKYHQVYKPHPSEVFFNVEDAKDFAQEFLKKKAEKRVTEPRPHRLLPVVRIGSKIEREFKICPVYQKRQKSEYDSDTCRHSFITISLIRIEPVATSGQAYWDFYQDYVYILPVGFEPAFIRLFRLQNRVTILSESTTKLLRDAAEKSKKDNHNWVVKSPKNKDGEEPAEV